MKVIEWGMFSSNDLIEMGDGNLQKGIEIINNDRWEILSEYKDTYSGETYYRVEREKIEQAEFDRKFMEDPEQKEQFEK